MRETRPVGVAVGRALRRVLVELGAHGWGGHRDPPCVLIRDEQHEDDAVTATTSGGSTAQAHAYGGKVPSANLETA